jgi:hypothetical protein
MEQLQKKFKGKAGIYKIENRLDGKVYMQVTSTEEVKNT